MAYISLGYHNADTKNIIVNTCSVCILETAKFQWKIYNILALKKCAEH